MRKPLLALTLIVTAFCRTVLAAETEKPEIYLVGNSHLDTQWRWTIQTTVNLFIHDTMVQNLALLEEYPDYIFNFEGAFKYALMKEYYPDLYERVKSYIALCRWHVSGSSWDANDVNIPSVESFIRNILLGQEFYEKEFGVRGTDIMLPDCFGFGAHLPSVAAHCGLTGFSTSKLDLRSNTYCEGGSVPFAFGIWKGPDGAGVMSALDGGSYGWSPYKTITAEDEYLGTCLDGEPIPAAFRYFGSKGDNGGSISPGSLAVLDAAVHDDTLPFKLRYATSDKMFHDYMWDERLPEYEGELVMDVHGTGCYTSKVEMKMLNRANEHRLAAAECISAACDWLGGVRYPHYTIDEGWKRVLSHHFHDDLTGTSTPDCYKFSYNDEYVTLRQMQSVIGKAEEDIVSVMNTEVKGIPVAVYNPLAAELADVVEVELPVPGRVSVSVFGPDGRKVGSQICSRRGDTVKVAFAACVPSAGIGIYDVRPLARESVPSSSLKVGENWIENSIYRVSVNAAGDISSIIDKRCGRELVRSGEAFSLDFIPENVSLKAPSWEIMKETVDRKPETVDGEVIVSVGECGPLRASLKVTRVHGGSSFEQRIVLTDGAADDRIDIENTVDWRSAGALLKARFPVSFDAPEASYDIGMAHVRRGNNTDTKYEVYAQQWADMSDPDGSYGVTILNDGRYGWDKPDDHTLRLTLFHTPASSKKSYVDQTLQDLGLHRFTYSIVGHPGLLEGESADISADRLNIPYVSFVTGKHEGALGRTFSFVSSSDDRLRIKAVKKAQDGDGLVVRVYNLADVPVNGILRFAGNVASAEELTGAETTLGEAPVKDGRLVVETGKYGMKTYRVRLKDSSVRIGCPTYVAIDLPYDVISITSDDFTVFGCLDDQQSFPAEILPESFSYLGIPFSFGEPNVCNALECRGQTLALPKGVKTLHLLAAGAKVSPGPWAKKMPRKAAEEGSGCFVVNGREIEAELSSFTGQYGLYEWPGYYDGCLRTDDVAYVSTHTHSPYGRNKPYVSSYMYLISIPVDGAEEIKLPSADIVIFSATASFGTP